MPKQLTKSYFYSLILPIFCLSFLLSVLVTSLKAQDFKKPLIEDIIIDDECVKLLKIQSVKLENAGAAKKLLTWTPLITLAGETNAPHAAFSILSTNWEELAAGIRDVDKLVFSVLATESLAHANTHESEPKLIAFWKAMSDFYVSRIPASVPSVTGGWKGSMTVEGKSVPISIKFIKEGSKVSGQFMVTSKNQGSCDNLKIEPDGSVSFSVGDGDQMTKFKGNVSRDFSKIEGTFTSNFGNGNWSVKQQ